MGTRSLTAFIDRHGNELVTVYRQYDGYPEGHGVGILEWGRGAHIVNGFRTPTKIEGVRLNGMQHAAMAYCSNFFDPDGNFYLMKGGTRDCGEEYLYTLTQREGGSVGDGEWPETFDRLWLEVEAYGDEVYSGWLDDFSPEECEASE